MLLTMPEILGRAQRRAGRLLRELLPHNDHYRPLGVHASSRALAATTEAVRYRPVVPAFTSRLVIPEGFYKAVSVYESTAHGKPRAEEAMPEAFVLELLGGRLYADNWDSVAVIAPDNYLVGDVSFQHNRLGWTLTAPEANNIFDQRYFLEPVRVPGTVLSLLSGGGAAMGNYYHWLIDSLPRLHLLREAGLFDEIDYFLVYDRKNQFVLDSLLHLGIADARIVDVTTHRHLQAERLLVTSPVRAGGRHSPPWVRTFLQQAYLPVPAATRRFAPRVYISRRDASMRRVLNEAEAEQILAGLGFKTYVLSDLSFIEKVALFSGAEAIVATVGAGMANLMFATPGTPVLELHPHTFVEPESMDTAYRVGLPYYWLTCQPSSERSTSYYHARHLDLFVDPRELLHAVRRMLRQAGKV
ncbi:glycosyltransferase family 61 protein [Hymenobacter sp. 5317J-9]|uniref:glycosyltransferase family 61 protein n=1 Tax=Hymenobacter sp. 5317J-9 TaxID=2932250 RepID=UPI001FD6601B|nr:glycosyltransferase family 61 protein [Hymenobacter sp. 5317J-9]UOQ96694.1 glycosyltransferase family 61 protein [Hymenobacter sp. 5317J-9]